jgi:IMP dehydrogenase
VEKMDIGTSYCFDDILMEPLYSKIISRSDISLETNIGTNGRNLILKTPLISSPMDTVTGKTMAISMALSGGLGIIHRYMTIDEQVDNVIKVKRFLQYIIQEPYCITSDTSYDELMELVDKYNVYSFCVVNNMVEKKLLDIVTRRDIDYMKYLITSNGKNGNINSTGKINIEYLVQDKNNKTHKLYALDISNTDKMEDILSIAKQLMLTHRIEKIPIVKGTKLIGLVTLKNIRHYEDNKTKACVDANGALCVGAAIGIVGDYMERLDKLILAGVDLICIDVANGFNENVISSTKTIRDKYSNIVLMVGNVCNWQGYRALSQIDIDCIRVGVGNGSICTTRLETGIGKGQFSATLECFHYKSQIDINSQTNSQIDISMYKPNIICDGGSLGKTGNKVKALACGASAIMLGRTLASTEESPGQIIFRNGRRFKYIRGMASTMANLSKQEKISITNKKLKTDFTAEGVDGEQELTGSVVDLIEQINGGIKSGMSYLGCNTITEVHEKSKNNEIKFNLVTSIGMSETGIRVKTY